jgi:hypothetical protein
MNINRREIIAGALATLFARSVPLQLPPYSSEPFHLVNSWGKWNDISEEALQDIRKWGIDQIDETTMREIFRSGGEIKKITTLELVEKPEMK